MKKLTSDQWEKKYVKEPIERFDVKNIMFNRWSWEPEMRPTVKDWRFYGEVTGKPGYELRDLALRRSSGYSTALSRFDMSKLSKPNPGRSILEMDKAIKAATKAAARPDFTPANKTAVPPLNPSEEEKARYFGNPEMVTRDIKKVAMCFGADLVGICKMDKRWEYSHTYEGEGPQGAPGDTPAVLGESKPQEIPEEFKYAVVMAFAEDYNMLKYHPTWIAHASTSIGYSIMAITNGHLSSFIRNLGYKAIESGNDIANSTVMAMQAGIGDLGRNGLLITPEFGPRVRLSKVITDLPLVPDSPIDFGVTEFCNVCEKCARMCPSQSILYGERTIEPNNISNSRGGLKWPINAETCRKYWGQVNKPCTTCISCCSYTKPRTPLHRTVGWFADHVRWADSFYVKMDDLFGYGKPKSPDNFWEEWRPQKL